VLGNQPTQKLGLAPGYKSLQLQQYFTAERDVTVTATNPIPGNPRMALYTKAVQEYNAARENTHQYQHFEVVVFNHKRKTFSKSF
jgi:hypothetical protein